MIDRVFFNLEPPEELVKLERNTLQVSMRDIQVHKEQLSETQGAIQSLRLFCIAVKIFVKDFYFFNTDVDILHKR